MSNKNQIERLAFNSFRGATKSVVFQFHKENPIVLIFGENGSGKSTIADALDFICNSDFGSLRLRSGTTPKSHIVSAIGKAQDLEVEMVYGGSTWQAKLLNGKIVTSPENPPQAFILRRADITKIMEATDSDRYKSLKEFITVPQIDAAEAALRLAYKTVTDEVNQSIQQKSTAETTLHNYWAAEGKPNSDYLNWARSAVKQPIDTLSAQITKNQSLRDKLDIAVQADKDLIASEGKYQTELEKQALLEKEYKEASQIQPNADLVLTLQAAKAFLYKHPKTDQCPVCSKPEAYDSLVSQIDTQLAQLQSIQSLQSRIELNNSAIQQAGGGKNLSAQRWKVAVSDILAILPTPLAGFPQIPASTTAEDFHPYLQKLVAQRSVLVAEIEKAERVVNQRNALLTHLATIEELKETMEMKHALSLRLQAIITVVEQERKLHVQNTVDGISGTVSQLYARIHPDEALGDPSFGIKANTSGSLTMKAKFGTNNDVPPVAYYSEGHLDTLGLCIYLALAKQSGNALVVLDDVLMSVDDPHLDRVIDIINEEAPNFGHVIITTHSRAWFNRVRLGKGMQAELIELYGWSLQNGMNHDHAPLAVNELRESVSALKLDRQAVASRAGILLEHILDDITLRYGSRLPRKQVSSYTLGELAGGIDKSLRKLFRVDKLDEAGNQSESIFLLALIEKATADGWIRNQVGAHFNPDEEGISDSMVRAFGENVLAIADAILCDHCHQLPTKNKSGSYWECGAGCGKIRLYPLTAPNRVANTE
jgi:energy-coupling factor transporter ATP-binding protein EcfA2